MDTVLWLCPSLPTETLKWLSSLPILMQESFWWWQCSDRYIISLFPQPPYPLPPPFFPSLISLMVSVDVKHHVYLRTYVLEDTMCLLACQVRVIVSDSGLCCWVCVASLEALCRMYMWEKKSYKDVWMREWEEYCNDGWMFLNKRPTMMCLAKQNKN